MIEIKALIDTYIEVNVVLALALLTWAALRLALRALGFERDYGLQQGLAKGLFLVALSSPLLGMIVSAAVPSLSVHVTDIALAQYLKGEVHVDAATLEAWLTMRHGFVIDLIYLNGTLAQVIAAGLVTASAFFVSRLLLGWLRLRRCLRVSFLWRRFGRLELRVSDTARIPFSTRGICYRYVVLPSHLLAESEPLKIVLAHELQHLRRADTEWEIGLSLLEPLLFWNPAFWIWRRELDAMRELACDQMVLDQGRISARDYAYCLLEICGGRGPVAQIRPSVPFVGSLRRRSFDVLCHRVMATTHEQSRRGKALLLPCLVILSLTLGVCANAIQGQRDWSQDRLMLSTIANLERLAAQNASFGAQSF